MDLTRSFCSAWRATLWLPSKGLPLALRDADPDTDPDRDLDLDLDLEWARSLSLSLSLSSYLLSNRSPRPRLTVSAFSSLCALSSLRREERREEQKIVCVSDSDSSIGLEVLQCCPALLCPIEVHSTRSACRLTSTCSNILNRLSSPYLQSPRLLFSSLHFTCLF